MPNPDPARAGRPLTFTPAEWRRLLEEPSFLRQTDNSYASPRRLMGVPVAIVPDHGECGWPRYLPPGRP